jgi:hypothetical protein
MTQGMAIPRESIFFRRDSKAHLLRGKPFVPQVGIGEMSHHALHRDPRRLTKSTMKSSAAAGGMPILPIPVSIFTCTATFVFCFCAASATARATFMS